MKQKHSINAESTDKKTKTKHADEEIGDKLKLKDIKINLVDIICMKDELVKPKDHKNIAIALKEDSIDLADIKDVNDIAKTKENSNGDVESKVRNRLRFEDDIVSMDTDASVGLLNDLTKECKVNMNLFDKPWIGSDGDKPTKAETKTDAKMDVDGRSNSIVTIHLSDDEVDQFIPSTHFDELVEPGMYRCKRCQQIFSTR